VARALFAPAKQSVLSSEVSSSARAHLEVWKLLEATPIETVFNRLADETKPLPPRPTKLEVLAAFWAFSQQHLPAVWSWRDWWRTAAIVPISGRTQLGRAKDMLSSRNPPAGCSSADWQFIIERAEILDEDWKGLIEWIKEKPEEPPILDGLPCRRFGQKDMAGILDGFRRTKLDQTPSFDQVFAQVAPRIFTKNPLDADEAIKFVQIAAKLNVTLGATAPVMFRCADGQWRQRSDNLVARSEIDLEYLLPEKWLQRHVISSEYEDGAQPAEIKNWRSWAVNPDKGGLSGFLLPAKHETKAWNLDRSFFQTRSASVPTRKFASSQWYYTDWNWDREIWDHWNRKVSDSANSIWVDVGAAIISSWSSLWDHVITYEVQQYGRNNFHRLDAGDVPATWLHELRTQPCVLDDRGNPRVPSELFRRTPDTLALLDVEPFVQDRWDLAGHQRPLDRLGVRTQPADAAKLLDRLRALSQIDTPPIGPLRDLYRAIERVLPRLRKEREGEVVAAFVAERIVRTERAWERSAFCFRENPGAIPGVSVLHPDVRDVIGLWEKLKVAPQPSVADALRWFASLPLDQALGDADLKAARQVLGLYPQDAWNREARWLTLQGRIIGTSDLRWGCMEQRAVPGLFTSVRSVSADFSMLDSSRLQAAMAAPPRLLETAIERRVSGYDPGSGNAANEEPWLHAVGDILSRVELGNVNETVLVADRQAAQRLMRTRWIPSRAVRIQPYLDGVAAGTPSELPTAWIADSLYVNGDSVRAYRSLVQELSRPFASSAAAVIIHDCVGRDASWIRAYADAYLKLSDEATQDVRAIAATADSPQPSSVFPALGQVSDQVRQGRSIAVSEDPPPQHAAAPTQERTEKKTPDEPAVATSKEPSKLDRLTTFLEGRGFQWHEDSGTFIHPDGSFVHKCEGAFKWELVAADRVNPLWLAPTGLSDPDGIEIPAEVWLAAGRCNAVLLAPESDTFQEHHFSVLRAEVESRALDLFPAVYRIRTSGDKGKSH